MKQFNKIILSIIIALTLAACNHKDLCYVEARKSRLFVKYDWSEAPDANPAGMCVFFYSVENPANYYRFDFNNSLGGEIEIPRGRYLLISYNNDTEVVRFSGTNIFESHKAYTREGDLLEPLYGNGVSSTVTTDNGERVFITPDGLWGCHATDIVVNEHGVSYTVIRYDDSRTSDPVETSVSSSDQTIMLFPHDMLCHYSYEVRNVDNINRISKISASLSGMSSAMTLSDESLDAEPATLPVSGSVDLTNQKIVGQFMTFGNYVGTKSTTAHKMEFFVVMDDGSKYRIAGDDNLDVTSQVDNAPDRRHVHIIIDRLKLPTPSESDENGWSPTVDDWGVAEEEIIV